jgi:hypothetical protein
MWRHYGKRIFVLIHIGIVDILTRTLEDMHGNIKATYKKGFYVIFF